MKLRLALTLAALTAWSTRIAADTGAIDSLSATVALLSAGQESGTGFFVVTGDADRFLVTAEHVARQMTTAARATVRTAGDRPYVIPLAKLAGTSKGIRWTRHGVADVAVLRLFPDEDVSDLLKEHFMPLSMVSREKAAPARELPLIILGFPLGLGVGEQFSPISQETKAASGLVTLSRFDIQTPASFFVLQSPSIGGYSGAPVFDVGAAHSGANGGIVLGGNWTMLGLVHGTLSDSSGGKLGAVTPSSYVAEVIDQALHGTGETFESNDHPYVLRLEYADPAVIRPAPRAP